MNAAAKNWIWFVALMLVILGIGIYVGSQRRTELGKSFEYSLDEYRKVDPKLITYQEAEPIVPATGNISALAIAADGAVYIGGENAIEVVGGKTIAIDGTPSCLAVDDAGSLFAGMQDHVLVISRDGKRKRWPSPAEKAYLTSVDMDDWYVYVADAGSRRIWRYKKEGGEPFEIGKKDWANGVRGFNIPSPFFDLAISRADGSLWAVNPGHHALENYRPDGMPLSKWEVSGMRIDGFSGCCNPSHFALLPDGGFVTAEKGLPRVKIHNVDGSLRCVVAAPDRFDEDASGLDVAVDVDGKIHVLDPGRNQVRVFEKIK
jgi:DNA-binding beta-propeller fold protein YncE